MHIYIPVEGITFDQASDFSEHLGKEIHSLVPEISTTEVSISRRGDKVFIDPSQNEYGDTLAAPYSARPFHLPTVSTPPSAREIKSGLDPHQFTIKTIAARVQKKGDLFAGALAPANRRWNSRALKELY